MRYVRRVGLGALLCTMAVVAAACGGGGGDETTAEATATETPDEGCYDGYPHRVSGQGVLKACSSGSLGLSVTNISNSVVKVSLVEPQSPFRGHFFPGSRKLGKRPPSRGTRGQRLRRRLVHAPPR
jgi:hypothetical protein